MSAGLNLCTKFYEKRRFKKDISKSGNNCEKGERINPAKSQLYIKFNNFVSSLQYTINIQYLPSLI